MIQQNMFYSVDLLRNVTSLEVEPDENREPLSPLSCMCNGRLAIAQGTSLTLLTPGMDGGGEDLLELEFDHSLEVLCWAPVSATSPSGPGSAVSGMVAGLLVAGDADGTLHFLTSSGVLVYSRRVIQGTVGAEMCSQAPVYSAKRAILCVDYNT